MTSTVPLIKPTHLSKTEHLRSIQLAYSGALSIINEAEIAPTSSECCFFQKMYRAFQTISELCDGCLKST